MKSPERTAGRGVSPLIGILLFGAALFSADFFAGRSGPKVELDDLPSPLRPVEVSILSQNEYQQRFDHLLHDGSSELMQCRRRALEHLGLMTNLGVRGAAPGGLRMHGLLQRVTGETDYPAYYRLGSDTIYTVSRAARVLRHEWVHAVQDQYADLKTEYERRTTTDGLYALRASVEGTAIWVSGGKPSLLSDGETLDAAAFALAYRDAPEWMRKRSAGDPLRSFSTLPASVYELKFERPVTKAPVSLPVLQPGGRILCEDELGILGLATALRKSGVETSAHEKILRAWRGDRLRFLADSRGEQQVIWGVVFADPQAAAAWAEGPAFRTPLTRAGITMPIWTVEFPVSVD